MVIFAIIIFGLAGVRTISKFVSDCLDPDENVIGRFISLSVVITYWWCYIWFLTQYITLK
jgi:hypothetical protein